MTLVEEKVLAIAAAPKKLLWSIGFISSSNQNWIVLPFSVSLDHLLFAW